MHSHCTSEADGHADTPRSWPCAHCGDAIEHTGKAGRPRRFCVDCVERYGASQLHTESCGTALFKKPGKGRGLRYCSPGCKRSFYSRCKCGAERPYGKKLCDGCRAERAPIGPGRRPCKHCGETFDAPNGKRKVCDVCRAQPAKLYAAAYAAYNASRRVTERFTHDCIECGDELVNGRTGGLMRCQSCSMQATWLARRPLPVCQWCGVKLETRRKRYCSHEHYVDHMRCIVIPETPTPPRSPARKIEPLRPICSWCGEHEVPKGKRSYCSKTCSGRAAHHAQRAREQRFSIRDDVRLAIYKRDDYVCYLCGEPCDLAADYNADHAPSLDHVLPRSAGGSDDVWNLRTAHRICNTRKRDRIITDQLAFAC